LLPRELAEALERDVADDVRIVFVPRDGEDSIEVRRAVLVDATFESREGELATLGRAFPVCRVREQVVDRRTTADLLHGREDGFGEGALLDLVDLASDLRVVRLYVVAGVRLLDELRLRVEPLLRVVLVRERDE